MKRPEWYVEVLDAVMRDSRTPEQTLKGINKLNEGLALPDTDMSEAAMKARLARNVLDIAVDIQRSEGFPADGDFLGEFLFGFGVASSLREMLKLDSGSRSVFINLLDMQELGWDEHKRFEEQDYTMIDRISHTFLTRLGFLQDGKHVIYEQLRMDKGGRVSASFVHPTLPFKVECFPAETLDRTPQPMIGKISISYVRPEMRVRREARK